MLQRIAPPIQVAAPQEVLTFAVELGVDLTDIEAVALQGLMHGTPPTSLEDEEIRVDTMLAPYRDPTEANRGAELWLLLDIGRQALATIR